MKVRFQTASRGGASYSNTIDLSNYDYNLVVSIPVKTKASANRSNGFDGLPPPQQPHSSPRLTPEVSSVSDPSSASQSRSASQHYMSNRNQVTSFPSE